MNELFTVRETCKLLKISPATLRRAFYEGRVPKPIRVGRRGIRWRSDDLREWIDQQATISSLEYADENARSSDGRGTNDFG